MTKHRNKASALLTTLFVLVVLSTIVLAFLESSSLERKISRSIKDTYQAELAAEAGLAEAIGRIYETTRTGPYAAVYLTTNNSPYLFLAKREFSANGTVTRRIPLFSTRETNFATLTNFSAAFLGNGSLALSDIDANGSNVSRTLSGVDVSTNINATNAAFPFGLVGLRNSAASTNHPTMPVDWIYLRNDQGKVICRYAFWTDDECSKLDLRFAGNPANITGNHTRANGASFSELSLLSLTNLPGVTNTQFSNALAYQNPDTLGLPFSTLELRYSLPGGGAALPTNVADALRPFVTVYSKHDDRSLDGKRRINLNELITSPADITTQTHAIRAAITNNLPEFGKRFYSASNGIATTPIDDHQKVYATRIAANIRDFIDADSASTLILADDTSHVGNSAALNIPYEPSEQQDEDLPLAFGKDGKGLKLSEYTRIVRVVNQPSGAHPGTSTNPVTIQARFGHYVELRNLSGKTISTADLGEDPHIVLAGRGSWINAFTNNSASPRRLDLSDVKMRLPNSLTIPPGGHVYFTTDGGSFPMDSQSQLLGSTTTNRYQLTFGTNPGQWSLINTNGNTPASTASGFEDYFITTRATNSGSRQRYAVYGSEDVGSPGYQNQQERLILANTSGILDFSLRIYTTVRQYISRNEDNPAWVNTFLNDPASETGRNTSSSSTSQPRYSRGDLRSNFDIVSVLQNTTALSWKSAGDGYGGNLYSPNPSVNQQTLGTTNYKYDVMLSLTGVERWQQGIFEITSDPAGNAFYNNTNITSLADLGYVYDPVRHDIAGYRSMGATLRFGQSDSATNNRATNSAIEYQNWLGGRGSDDVTNAAFGRNAFLLMDVFRTDTNTSGRINPNSVVRDRSGAVMRAALGNFIFETQSTNGASTLLQSLTLNETNSFAAIQSFATNSSNGFLVSAGDLSRIPAFWSTNNGATAPVPGVRMSDASDSGKEEFLRRTANLLTTQSLAYSVFVVAQAGSIQSQGGTDRFVPISSITTESVIQLDPTYPSSPPETPPAPSAWKILKPRTIFH